MEEDDKIDPEDEENEVPEEDVTVVPVEDEDLALLDETMHHGHMTFLEHLEELRIVLFKSAAAFLISFIIIAVFFKQINTLIRMPLERAMENQGVTEALVTTSPFGIFSFLLQMGFMGGLTLSSPFILYFATSFIAPGLNKKEKRALLPGALAALFLLCLGATFSYVVLIPSALNVSIYFNEMMGVSLMWAADKYMSLLLWMILGVGLLFEFPLVIAIAVYVGVLTQLQLKTFRRYAIVIIFILAAFITPTQDPITMLLMAFPLMVLYEGSIIVGGFIERKKKNTYEAEFGAWDKDDEDRHD
jgi:sec-independent protein translocase protein TatC